MTKGRTDIMNFSCVTAAKNLIKRTQLQYKSSKVDRNRGKSEKSKANFNTTPVEDMDGFYQNFSLSKGKVISNSVQFKIYPVKFSCLYHCHDGLVVRVCGDKCPSLGFS